MSASCWAVLALSLAAYAAISLLVFHQPFYEGLRRLRFFDLGVYRGGAGAVLGGRPLYAPGIYQGMSFTYPPFAALVFIPTQLSGIVVDSAISCIFNVGALLAVLWLTPRLSTRSSADHQPERGLPGSRWTVVALLGAVAMWSEPVTVTVGYGQIDLAITLLMVWDLSRTPNTPARGIAIGIAAGLKLTPLIFIPYLLLSRQRRTATTATASFLATIIIGFAALPADSTRFWNGTFLDASRTGDIADAGNQAVLGAIARLSHTQHVNAGWTIALATVALAGLIVAIRAGRRGDHGAGFAVCAITSLLASPVSSTHHWVLAIPAVVALAAWAKQRRAWITLGTIVALTVSAYTYLPETLMGDSGGLHLGPAGQILAAPYVILGLAVVLCVGVAGERHTAADERRDPGPGWRRQTTTAAHESIAGQAARRSDPPAPTPRQTVTF